MATKPDRISKTWSVRKDLAERVEQEADLRVIGQTLIVEKALETFFDALTPPVDTGSTIPPVDPAFGPKETKA